MKQLLDAYKLILETGTLHHDRTGVGTLRIPGHMMQFDLREGFPAVTTKRLAFKSMVGELIGFLRGYNNAEDFARLGCHWWYDNANRNQDWLNNTARKGDGDLGRIYGVQWRNWITDPAVYEASMGTQGYVDQLYVVVNTIIHNPDSRRNIMHAWNIADLQQMALPPCHVMYQFIADKQRKELHLCMYQRSCDMFLGVPMNIASAALLLSLVAHVTGYTPAMFTHFLGDAHIYLTHEDAVREQMVREPRILPQLTIGGYDLGYEQPIDVTSRVDWLTTIMPEAINLVGYTSHPPISAPMAI